MVKEQRSYHLDILRILAIFAVVFMHVSGHISLKMGDDTSSVYWHICNIFDSGTRWAVPMFVMISGYLFLNPQKEIGTKDIYKKNILRMVISYLFWSFLYTLLLSTVQNYNVFSKQGIIDLFIGTIKGGMYHLWFIPMLIGLYIVVPVLRVLIANASQKTLSYFILVMLIFESVVKPLTNVSIFNSLFGERVDTISLGLSVGGYVLYFVLGYYINTVSFTKLQKRVIYLLGVLSFVITVGATSVLSFVSGKEILNFRDNFSLNVFFMSASVFLFVKERCENKDFSAGARKLILFLSKYSFGLYLIHLFILTWLVDFYVCSNAMVLLLIVLYFVICCVIPLLVSWIIGKIPLLKKYII